MLILPPLTPPLVEARSAGDCAIAHSIGRSPQDNSSSRGADMNFDSLLIRTYNDRLAARGFQEKTRQSYTRFFSIFVSFVRTAFPEWTPFENSQADRHVVQTYGSYLLAEQNKKVATMNIAICAVSRFFSMNGYHYRFKVQQAPPREPIDVISDDEATRLREVCQKISIKHGAMVLLMLNAGLRPQELIDLRLHDVELTRKCISVRSAEGPRNITLSEESMSSLRLWLAERQSYPNSNDVVFVNNSGLPMSMQGLDFVIKSVGQKARLLLSARKLRNTCIKQLIAAGIGMTDVMLFAGYRNVSSLWRHYTG
jgi:site-specific recombinase XerD